MAMHNLPSEIISTQTSNFTPQKASEDDMIMVIGHGLFILKQVN